MFFLDSRRQGSLAKDPEPIMFTKDRPERTDGYLERNIEKLKKRSRSRKDKARFGDQNDSSMSGSTASLLDGRSDTTYSKVQSDFRMTGKQFVTLEEARESKGKPFQCHHISYTYYV